MMYHLFSLDELNMRDKLTWHLMENMGGMTINANRIELQEIKFKFWNFTL